MRAKSRDELVAHLSGFLRAVSSFSGSLRDYEFFSYSLGFDGSETDVEKKINDYFRGQFTFSFGGLTKLTSLRDLESRIGHHLIRESRCISNECIPDLRSYLSFRVMDMIGDIFGDELSKVDAFELVEVASQPSHSSIFLCITNKNLLLVLQFNGDH